MDDTKAKTVTVNTADGGTMHVTVFNLRHMSLDSREGWHACPPLSSTQPAYATPQDAALAHARNCGKTPASMGQIHDAVCEAIEDILPVAAELPCETSEVEHLLRENTRLVLVNARLAEWSTSLLLAATAPGTARAFVSAVTFRKELKALGYTEDDELWRHPSANSHGSTMAQSFAIFVSDIDPLAHLGTVAVATHVNRVVLLTRLVVRQNRADLATRLAQGGTR